MEDAHTDIRGAVELTARQIEVWQHLHKGLSNEDIHRLLGISPNTVKLHAAAIYKRLHVANRAEAAAAYERLLACESRTEAALRARVRAVQRAGCPTIAVIPFVDYSQAQDHFSEGLAEDLICRLGKWRWFPVVAFSSSRSYRLQTHTIKQITSALQATYLVSGSAHRYSNRIRVVVSLATIPEGRSIWSEKYDRTLDDTLLAQDEIAEKIVARICPELLETECERVSDDSRTPLSTWEHVALGIALIARRDRSCVKHAIEKFDAALELSPDSGLAWYGRAYAHYMTMVEQWSDHAVAAAEFLKCAEACMRYGPHDSGCRMMYGLSRMIREDLNEAVFHLREAVAINPSNTQALGVLGQLTALQGTKEAFEEAIGHLEAALQLNPHDSTTWLQLCALAMIYFAKEDYVPGIELSRRAIALQPDSTLPRAALIACAQRAGLRADVDDGVRALLAMNAGFNIEGFGRFFATAPRQSVQRLLAALAEAGLSVP